MTAAHRAHCVLLAVLFLLALCTGEALDDILETRSAAEKSERPVAPLAFRLGSGASVEPDPPSIAPVKGNSLKVELKPQPVVTWVGEPHTISKIT